ncbi:MAG: gamma-glutamyltransferase [Thermoanaerobaculia bacterium]
MKRLLLFLLAGGLITQSLFAGGVTVASHAAVATDSPLSTAVALDVLRNGGNAIDAAVAAQFTLAVVHPHSGNLGGGGFLLYYDRKSNAVWALDFRELSPANLPERKKEKGDATEPGRGASVAVPGTVAGLAAAQSKFGRASWASLLASPIELAREGFKVDDDLRSAIETEHERAGLDRNSDAAFFFENGAAVAAGTTIRQPELASTLERLAQQGEKGFYEGVTAKKIVAAVQQAGGTLGFLDLSEYRPVWRAPIQIDYAGLRICSVPPPSTGGMILAESLSILDNAELAKIDPAHQDLLHLVAEAERRAYIDRNLFLGDPDHVRIPFRELLSREHGAAWFKSVDRSHASRSVDVREGSPQSEHTTHISVVDADGNVAALTTSLDGDFGSGLMAGGFFLNDAMSDFTASAPAPTLKGLVDSDRNAIAPKTRMLSPLAPTIVMEKGKPLFALGSSGGAMIPTTILSIILRVALHGASLADAVAAPRFHEQANPDQIVVERDAFPPPVLDALRRMGHQIEQRDPWGNVEAVMIDGEKRIAVSDPRRGGAAGGY